MVALFKSTYDRIYMLWVDTQKETPIFLDVTETSFTFKSVELIEKNGGTDDIWDEVEITVTSEMILNQRLANNANENDVEPINFFRRIGSTPKTLDEKVALKKQTFRLEDLESVFEGEKDTQIQFLLDYSKCVFIGLDIDTHYL